MSFRCQKCGEARPNQDFPKEYAPTQVVTKTRTHVERPGIKIVQELKLFCAACAAHVKEPTNEVVGAATTRKASDYYDPMADEPREIREEH